MADLTEIRKKAWETRRAKYGNIGHGGSYGRSSANHDGMLSLIVRLHQEGTLSEGQVAKATGLGRVEIRRLTDEAKARRSAALDELGALDGELLDRPPHPGMEG
jgi:hypothetical protein